MMMQIKNSKTIFRGGFSKEFPSEFSKEFSNTPARQAGAILLIAMVVLVAMTLSALALIKSVNTTNLIAGNLGFRESALLAADRSTEHALRFLDKKESDCPGGKCRWTDDPKNCYWATRQIEPDNPEYPEYKTWEDVMNKLIKISQEKDGNCGFKDEAGNNVWYAIQRLCRLQGAAVAPPTLAQCSLSTERVAGGSNAYTTTGSVSKKIFYRITTRVNGPRNTAVYTQTIITK